MLKKGKVLVRESKKTTSKSDLERIKRRIAKQKKLVSESKEEVRKAKIEKAKRKRKATGKLGKAGLVKKSKKVISESKMKEIAKIKAKKKLAKKSKSVKKGLDKVVTKEMISESVKRKISALGKKRGFGKKVVKEADEDEIFTDLVEDEGVDIGDGEGIEVEADLEISTEEPIDITIQQDDLESIILGVKEELAEDEEFVNIVVNKIAGTDEPMDEINQELETEIDSDLIDDEMLEDEMNEGDILDDMLEEEGLKGKAKRKLATEGIEVNVSTDGLILEGFETETKSDSKMKVNMFKYTATMLDKVREHEAVTGSLALIKESLMSDEDEINNFEVEVDEEGETITINSSSKIGDVSSAITKATGLSVGKVAKQTYEKEIEIDADVEDLDYDLSGAMKW